jgi:hypothetical protein
MSGEWKSSMARRLFLSRLGAGAGVQMSTRGIATRIAKATGADTDAIVKEIGANLIANSHFVPAGVLAVNRAQERGYSFVYAT